MRANKISSRGERVISGDAMDLDHLKPSAVS